MKTLLLWLCSICITLHCSSQSVYTVSNTAGGNFSLNDISLEWSVGEMPFIQTMESSLGDLYITNGFLQPSVIYASRFPVADSLKIGIMPNPTNGIIKVHLLSTEHGPVSIWVYDVYGKRVLNLYAYNYGNGFSQQIDLSRFAAGTYLIRVEYTTEQGGRKKVGYHKIIKL